MSCNQFIATFLTGTSYRRDKDTILSDALNGLRHSFIVSHSEGVVWKWMKFIQRDFLNRFVHIYLRFWGKGKGVHCLDRQRTP